MIKIGDLSDALNTRRINIKREGWQVAVLPVYLGGGRGGLARDLTEWRDSSLILTSILPFEKADRLLGQKRTSSHLY